MIDSYNNQVRKLGLSRLSLSNFRNYKDVVIDFDLKPVVITGTNGSGKTNILEAISFLSPGKGLRNIAKLNQATIRDSSGFESESLNWALNFLVHSKDGQSKFGTALDNLTNKRLIRIDDKTISSQTSLAKVFNVIWLIPQMDGLFLGASLDRRRFLDKMVDNFYPEHFSHIYSYEYSMRERAKLLQVNPDPVWLSTLENKMVEKAVSIAASRMDTISFIQQAIDKATTCFPKANISVIGFVEDLLKNYKAVEAEEIFREKLYQARYLDRNSKRTNFGIHKSDLSVIYSDKNMPASLCSTGEQKALLISLIMAQVRAKIEWHGVIPVLLLDEVVAHLDEGRRNSLYQELLDLGAQTFMTGVSDELFTFLANKAQYLSINNGKLVM